MPARRPSWHPIVLQPGSMQRPAKRALDALAWAALGLAISVKAAAGPENVTPPSRVELLARAEKERAAGHDAAALGAALAAAKMSVTSSLLRFIAEEHRALHQLGLAYEAARSCTETAAEEPPSKNHDAVFLGCRELMHELEPHLALVTFGWRGELPEHTRFVVDGELLTPERRTRAFDPGKHRIWLDADGYVPVALELSLNAGDAPHVDLTLAPRTPPRAAPSATTTRATTPPASATRAANAPADTRPGGALTWPILVTGAGAALFGAALATSLDSNAKYADLRRACSRSACGSAPAERRSIEALDGATTVLVLAGSAVAGAGAVWLGLTLAARGRSAKTEVGVGPGFCSVRGAF